MVLPSNSFALLSAGASGEALAAFDHHAFCVIGAETGVRAERLVHRIHDLDRDRFVFSPGERGGKLVFRHVSLHSVRALLRT
jgi:hypothetical protein